MKKLSFFIAVVGFVVAAVSCNKTEPISMSSDIVVNFTVSDLEPETKAVKNSWEKGDVINVYLSDTFALDPDFTLTFNGSSWKSSVLSQEVIDRLEPTGKVNCFWEASNSSGDWKSSAIDNAYIKYFPEDGDGTKVFLAARSNAVDYEFDGEELNATIDKWIFLTTVQVVVAGLDSEAAARYSLSCNQISVPSSIQVYRDNAESDPRIIVSSGTGGGTICGIPNEDGVAFVGGRVVDRDGKFVFTLYDSVEKTTSSYTVPSLSEQISFNDSKVVSLRIALEKFE